MPSYQVVNGHPRLVKLAVEHSFSTMQGIVAQSIAICVFPFVIVVTRAINFGYPGSGALTIHAGPAARTVLEAARPFACHLSLAVSLARGLPPSAYLPSLQSSMPLFLPRYHLDHLQQVHFRCLRDWQLLGWPSGKASRKERPCSCQTRCRAP